MTRDLLTAIATGIVLGLMLIVLCAYVIAFYGGQTSV